MNNRQRNDSPNDSGCLNLIHGKSQWIARRTPRAEMITAERDVEIEQINKLLR
jgi:hypothetical protein